MVAKKKVLPMRRSARLDVGNFIFAVIVVILMVNVFRYFTKEHISFYEVTEKAIADDNVCQGVILRNEVIIRSDLDGYISYYAGAGERVGKNAAVYSVDESGDIYGLLTSEETEGNLQKKDWYAVRNDISSYVQDYSDSNYSRVIDFKYDIENTMLELKNVNLLKNVKTLLKENGSSAAFRIVKAPQSGIVSYCFDGMEDMTIDQVTSDTFNRDTYTRTQLRSSQQVTSGSAVYKLISDENWKVVVKLTQSQYEKTVDKERINVTFVKDNLKATAEISAYEKEDGYFACLSLDKYMIQYLNDRFLEIELSINSAEGLKLPNSSICTRTFYKIPKEYYRENEEGTGGVYRDEYNENGEKTVTFTEVKSFLSEDDYVYIDTKAVPSGAVLNAEQGESFVLAETVDMEGVFNVNNGYCVFERIVKVYENADYTIVEKEAANSISVYDHIVLNASLVEDGDILY